MAKIELRDYQLRALSMLYRWLENNAGNPCVVLPTGSGKGIVIAELCRYAVKEWPETRIVMLTRSVELINQNAEKLRMIWPCAPFGIYSASAGKKQLGRSITIGGPLSIVRVTKKIGHCDILIVDEAHDISHKDEGSYRKIIDDLIAINPSMRVIGFTASPYRLGHGMITDKPAIFDALIEPTSIEDLVAKNYLAVLRSKHTELEISTEGVRKRRGGDFIESELQEVADTEDNNRALIDEAIRRSGGGKSWIFFATGIRHAENLRDLLIANGISAVSVTGNMSKKDRDQAIRDFKSGKITAITQVGCLNVGFDHPGIDLLVMARPTMSPGLYLQQAGRGMRIAPGKKSCTVLDFSGNVSRHGPVTDITPPKKGGEGGGDAPVKTCPDCSEIVPASAKACPACGHLFPGVEKQPPRLHNDDIMGIEPQEMACISWKWSVQKSRNSGIDMLVCKHYGALSDPSITEYFCIMHPGYPGRVAFRALMDLASHAGIADSDKMLSLSLDTLAGAMNGANPPSKVLYKKEGKFFKVISRSW